MSALRAYLLALAGWILTARSPVFEKKGDRVLFPGLGWPAAENESEKVACGAVEKVDSREPRELREQENYRKSQ